MKKKGIIIGVIVLVLLLVVGGVFFYVKNKDDDKKSSSNKTEKITITFDADGGVTVEDITFKKGTSVKLPTTTKDGYIFAGWFNGSEEVTAADTSKLEKNIVLTAKWEEKTPDKKYIKITYDSKGGSKVKADEFECVNDSYTIESFPKNPTKDGYTFRAWEDKHGKAILTGAKLTCENITLYAAWDKKEETKPDTKVSYKCNEGVLNGDKCVIEKDAKTKCPSDTYEFNGKCVTLAASVIDKNQINRVCGKSTVVVDSNGHTQEVQGTLTYVGDSVDKAQYWYCAYGATDESQYECTTHGHKWVGKLNKCYRSTGNPGQNITYSCKNSNSYVYLSVSDANSLRQNSNLSGCFPYVSKTSYCEDGFTLIDGKCNKKVDAIKVTE